MIIFIISLILFILIGPFLNVSFKYLEKNAPNEKIRKRLEEANKQRKIGDVPNRFALISFVSVLLLSIILLMVFFIRK